VVFGFSYRSAGRLVEFLKTHRRGHQAKATNQIDERASRKSSIFLK